MKTYKAFLILTFALLFSFGLMGCSNIQSKFTKEVQLTTENIEEYFNINTYADSYSESYRKDLFGFNNYSCSCVSRISVSKMYDFEIKEPIKIKFSFSSSWDSIQGATKEDDLVTYATISVPVSGSIEKAYSCSIDTFWTMADNLPIARIEEVVGTIYVTE